MGLKNDPWDQRSVDTDTIRHSLGSSVMIAASLPFVGHGRCRSAILRIFCFLRTGPYVLSWLAGADQTYLAFHSFVFRCVAFVVVSLSLCTL